MIIAERNGQRREFTKHLWDIIGTDKYGWVIVPNEVANNSDDNQVKVVSGQMLHPSQTVNKAQKRRKK